MSGIFETFVQLIGALEFWTLVWVAALLAAVCAAIYLSATQARRARRKQEREAAWRARSHLRIRGA